jgi:hypothetical protein
MEHSVDHHAVIKPPPTARRIGRQQRRQPTPLRRPHPQSSQQSPRLRLWKTQLALLAAEKGLKITVVHLPPGTSKWNRIEHRLFSAITVNWRGRPLTSYEVVVETIGAVTSKTGLTVEARLDLGSYPKGVKISDKDMAVSLLTAMPSISTGTTQSSRGRAPRRHARTKGSSSRATPYRTEPLENQAPPAHTRTPHPSPPQI